ncbi:hypothetical protein PHYBOEH_002700 [Phytophthora boehmeriae]|uniref:Protein kinase domain-containing protein n=1 Tax=Phytophthora boehmeriae TaxID=109152 RepID=A0A8T1X4P0_9STRA|nr:hypothetical protein PHYBOEH_002700 [Phytophthora boehmeriae]
MAASWIGKELDLPLKPFSLETYFEVLDIVGTGMLGKVRVIRHKRTSLYYAIKSIKKKDVLDRKMTGHLEAERDWLRKPNDRTSSSVGTPQYLAPEQLTLSNKARSYSRVVDWWAFACVLYEMVNGSPPFTTNQDGGDSHYALYTRILSGKIYWPRHLQAPLKDLLRQMLLPDPAKRLSNVESIKKHAWFEGVDWTIVPLCQVVAPHPPTLSCAGDTDNFDDYPSSTEETLPLDDDMNRYDFCTF